MDHRVVDPNHLELHPQFERLFEPPTQAEVSQRAAAMSRGEPFPPLLVDARGRVLAGVACWRAARRLGWRQISAVVAPEMSPAELRALIVAENIRTRNLREVHLWRAMNNFFDMEPLRPPGGW